LKETKSLFIFSLYKSRNSNILHYFTKKNLKEKFNLEEILNEKKRFEDEKEKRNKK